MRFDKVGYSVASATAKDTNHAIRTAWSVFEAIGLRRWRQRDRHFPSSPNCDGAANSENISNVLKLYRCLHKKRSRGSLLD
jgi:hypothetical protein